MTVCVFRKSSCRIILATVFLALALVILGVPGPAHATEPFNQTDGIAIYGYDPVAYFTDGQAVKGSDEFAYEWLGATWYFASAEHRDLFATDPIKYAPQYGGYCAIGMIDGGTWGTNPEHWRIVDGKLYMYDGSQADMARWERDAPKNIEKADAEWQLLKTELTD